MKPGLLAASVMIMCLATALLAASFVVNYHGAPGDNDMGIYAWPGSVLLLFGGSLLRSALGGTRRSPPDTGLL